MKRKYTGNVTRFGSNCSGSSLLLPPGGAALSQPPRHSWEEALPPGNSFSLPAGHASAGGLFGAGAGGLFGAGAGGLFGDSRNDERGQSSHKGASNQSKAASGSLFDPPSLR